MSADTTPGLEAERAAFEALPEFVADPGLLQRQLDGSSYIYTHVDGMWVGWQAARRAPAPVPQGPTLAEFALQALVAAGHVTQDKVDAAMRLPGAPAASGEPAAEEHEQAPAYRLLERSDRIAQDDEFLDDDATTWAKDAGGLFVGMLYAPGALRPGRRVIKP